MQQIPKFTVLFLLLLITACSTRPDASNIINKAIKAHGGVAYEHSRIAFTFRGVNYTARQQEDSFVFTRTFPDSLGGITDSLTNRGLSRTIAGEKEALSVADSSAYANALNSVIYFARLPYKLNDAAVQKTFLGTSTIGGEPYFKIGVQFKKEGGGKDYQDYFVYWIHRKRYTMDYLAYDFKENGGGTRFRQAYHIRKINGIRFADYHNFKGINRGDSLQNYDRLFRQGDVEKVSDIKLKDINVELQD